MHIKNSSKSTSLEVSAPKLKIKDSRVLFFESKDVPSLNLPKYFKLCNASSVSVALSARAEHICNQAWL